MNEVTAHIGIYCLDQDRETSSTLGVLNFTRNLVRALAAQSDPGGCRVTLFVADSNRVEFTPSRLPDWMGVEVIPGIHHRGWRRLWADHVIARRLMGKVDLLHFPKGWMPLVPRRGTRTIVTLHDAITQHYAVHYPESCRFNMRYFNWAMRHSLRRADQVVTISAFSAQQLRVFGPLKAPLEVIPSGAVSGPAPPAPEARQGVVVLGSVRPHKRTRETLELLSAYAAERDTTLSVHVLGLDGWAQLGDDPAPTRLDLNFAGRCDTAAYRRHVGRARCVVYLSEIEGFGLPLLESYELGTPVCYRATGAMAEAMNGCPGGWDGGQPDTFFRALDRVLTMRWPDVLAIRERLARRFDWADIAGRYQTLYRKVATR